MVPVTFVAYPEAEEEEEGDGSEDGGGEGDDEETARERRATETSGTTTVAEGPARASPALVDDGWREKKKSSIVCFYCSQPLYR